MPYVGVKPAGITSATEAEIAGNLTVDTNTLVVDATNNNVGVNTTAVAADFEVGASASKINALTVKTATGSGGVAGISFMAGQTTAGREKAAMFFKETNGGAHYTGDLVFAIATSSGSAAQVAASDEVCRITSNGLTFNGDTAATNALDDYEEGTWTVNLYKGGSALAVGSRYGYYTKVGRLLYISFYWYNNSITTTGSSNYTIQGMPYSLPHASSSGWQFIPTGYMNFGSNEVHRWQVNATDTLTLYGNSATDNASGTIEFSGAGVFFTS